MLHFFDHEYNLDQGPDSVGRAPNLSRLGKISAFWELVFDPVNQETADLLEYAEFTFRDLTPQWVVNDKELMLLAVALDPYVTMHHVPAHLAEDRDMVEIAINKTEFIGWMSENAQRMYPDLLAHFVRKNCQKGSGANLWEAIDGISDETWGNIDVVCRAWFETTGTWYEDFPEFPEANKSNPEFALLAAQYACHSFFRVAPELRNDKAFALRAIETNPCTYLSLSTALKSDHDIALLAFTHERTDDLFKARDRAYEQQHLRAFTMPHLHFWLRDKDAAVANIRDYRAFMKGFLPGFSSSVREASASSCISIIDTEPALRKNIAGFVGVLSPSKVEKLKTYAANLEKWCSFFSY